MTKNHKQIVTIFLFMPFLLYFRRVTLRFL